jgi:hypothetical protein
MSITVVKSKGGVEDLQFDILGTNETVSVKTSSGGSRQVRKINASHVPVTATTRAKTDASGTILTETDVDTVLQQVLTDNASQGIPDGTTIEVSSGSMRVKDAGISTAKLASNAVTTAKITDANVTAGKLASDAVTTAKILDENVTAGKLASDAVTEAKILNGAVTNLKVPITTLKWDRMFEAPARYVASCSTVAFVGDATAEALSITGIASTDIIVAQMLSYTNSAYILKAVAGTNVVTLTWNATPGVGSVNIIAYRAVTPTA